MLKKNVVEDSFLCNLESKTDEVTNRNDIDSQGINKSISDDTSIASDVDVYQDIAEVGNREDALEFTSEGEEDDEHTVQEVQGEQEAEQEVEDEQEVPEENKKQIIDEVPNEEGFIVLCPDREEEKSAGPLSSNKDKIVGSPLKEKRLAKKNTKDKSKGNGRGGNPLIEEATFVSSPSKSSVRSKYNFLSIYDEKSTSGLAVPVTLITSQKDSLSRIKAISKYIASFKYNHTGEKFFQRKRDVGLNFISMVSHEIMKKKKIATPIQCVEAFYLAGYLTTGMENILRIPLSFKTIVKVEQMEDKGNDTNLTSIINENEIACNEVEEIDTDLEENDKEIIFDEKERHKSRKIKTLIFRHIVLAISYAGKWGALGISRQKTLMNKDLIYPNLSDLVNNFIHSYSRIGHSVETVYAGLPLPHDISSLTPVRWRFLELNLALKKETRSSSQLSYDEDNTNKNTDSGDQEIKNEKCGRNINTSAVLDEVNARSINNYTKCVEYFQTQNDSSTDYFSISKEKLFDMLSLKGEYPRKFLSAFKQYTISSRMEKLRNAREERDREKSNINNNTQRDCSKTDSPSKTLRQKSIILRNIIRFKEIQKNRNIERQDEALNEAKRTIAKKMKVEEATEENEIIKEINFHSDITRPTSSSTNKIESSQTDSIKKSIALIDPQSRLLNQTVNTKSKTIVIEPSKGSKLREKILKAIKSDNQLSSVPEMKKIPVMKNVRERETSSKDTSRKEHQHLKDTRRENHGISLSSSAIQDNNSNTNSNQLEDIKKAKKNVKKNNQSQRSHKNIHQQIDKEKKKKTKKKHRRRNSSTSTSSNVSKGSLLSKIGDIGELLRTVKDDIQDENEGRASPQHDKRADNENKNYGPYAILDKIQRNSVAKHQTKNKIMTFFQEKSKKDYLKTVSNVENDEDHKNLDTTSVGPEFQSSPRTENQNKQIQKSCRNGKQIQRVKTKSQINKSGGKKRKTSISQVVFEFDREDFIQSEPKQILGLSDESMNKLSVLSNHCSQKPLTNIRSKYTL